MEQAETEQVVKGVVRRVTYRNPTNGYSVIQMTVPDEREQVTVVGTSVDAQVGSHILVRGTFRTHPKFGRQLTAASITPTTPSTKEGLARYLSSGVIKGIGEKTAEKLVEEFGTEVMEIIYRQPEKLAESIGTHKASLIHETFGKQRELQDVMQFLIENNISTSLAHRIYDKYKNEAVEILKRDPYLLAREMRGVGFITADTIAQNLGLAPDAPQRLKAGLYYALEKAMDEGHCYLEEPHLIQRGRTLLAVGDGVELNSHIETLIEEGYVVRHAGGIFTRTLERAEDFVANFVAARVEPLSDDAISQGEIQAGVERVAKDLGLSFSFDQEQAVHAAFKHRLLIITGGPGCGKTTIIRALSHVFRSLGNRLMMAAPTGRAAQRMSQVCEMPASTIHRLLRYDPLTGRFVHGPNDPLPVDALIIDETSMMDVQLARDLFSAVPRNCHLILVGDKDQLPSVGPGRVFADLISVPKIKTVALTHLFRRSQESSINSIAHLINSGTVPSIPQPDGVTKVDAYFIPRSDAEEAAQTIEKLVADQLPKKFGFSPQDITVLTPSNRGVLGTISLNARLQARINPQGDPEQEIAVQDLTLRLGDRVCQRVNNYQLDTNGVFNGDLGEIHSVNARDRALLVELWDGRLVKYQDRDVSQLALAYAVTVHRSQGSEIPCVVLALHESQYTLLERQLIYTGVTRAKKLLVVVGSPRALSLACKRVSGKKRCTMLRARILEGIKESS